MLCMAYYLGRNLSLRAANSVWDYSWHSDRAISEGVAACAAVRLSESVWFYASSPLNGYWGAL